MRNYHEQAKERGVVLLALLVLLVFVLIGGAFFFVKQAQDKKSVSTTAAEVAEAGGSALSRSAQNVQRKNDAARLLSATAEYMNNNNGQLPMEIQASMLEGMGHYTGASLVAGEQEALRNDKLRLVAAAACASGGATQASLMRNYAVQYALQNADDAFEPQCKNG